MLGSGVAMRELGNFLEPAPCPLEEEGEMKSSIGSGV